MSKHTPNRAPAHERLHALVDRLASSYRGALGWREPLSADTKTRLMLIEDCIKEADGAVEDPILAAAPELLDALKVACDKLEKVIPDWEQTYIRKVIAKAEGRK